MFTKTEAEKIARKLRADLEQGRKHTQALVRYNGKIVARYGIRRGHRDLPHDYLPDQLFLTPRQTRELASCTLSDEEYFEILRDSKKL